MVTPICKVQSNVGKNLSPAFGLLYVQCQMDIVIGLTRYVGYMTETNKEQYGETQILEEHHQPTGMQQ